MLFCAKENKYIMLFGVHIQFQDMHFFNKIKETNIIQIQRHRDFNSGDVVQKCRMRYNKYRI